MKVIQFGLHYSPNVGDGIIAECLAHAVQCLRPGVTFETVDISGRTDFGAVTVKNRELALKVLRNLPRGVRHKLVLAKHGKMLDGVEPSWQRAIEGADLCFLGGGQIFSDADLNFPAKISRVAKVVRQAGVPMGVYAVGVSQNWSTQGRALFSDIFETDLRMVGVRDAPSCDAWLAETDNRAPLPEITRDPGLLAASCYGGSADAGPRIGVCVTSPDILTYHADRDVAGRNGGDFFGDVVRGIAAAGHQVRVFCNGAVEDRRAMAALVDTPDIDRLVSDGTVEMMEAPRTPGDLARQIAGCRAVIAHRLHACIVAYSYGKPVIGLGWDRKVESFFGSVGLERSFFGGASVSPDAVVGRLKDALEEGIDMSIHGRATEEAWSGVDRVLTACGSVRDA